jgi:MFS family permease
MNQLVNRLGFWSAVIIVLLAISIDVGMIVSTILFPMTSITSIETYASSFSSFQMLPFIPSLLLAPVFVIMMLCIHYYASQEKKVLSQLGFSFALICAAVLSIHYYIQLTVVQQGILNNELSGLWQFAAPNPHSFFWAFAALGYGFMGIALLFVAPIFKEKSENAVKWLFIANGLVGIAFLIGNALGFFLVNIFASFVWGVLFPIASILMAKKFRKTSLHSQDSKGRNETKVL